MIVRASHAFRQVEALRLIRIRQFSSSRALLATPINHYETLGISPTASASEIKKQFYALSKSYHPDLHPNDPTASDRFVQISESYAVLGSPDKRAAYDRTITPASAAPTPRGSYSSHTASGTPAGGRPASGLSRRRTQFRGPPPSFYASGGWGAQGSKRAEHAARAEEAGQTQTEPGTGPGGFAAGLDNDVPHFDREGHIRTHEGVAASRHRTRRGAWAAREDLGSEIRAAGGPLSGFLMITGVLVFAMGVGGIINSGGAGGKRRRDE